MTRRHPNTYLYKDLLDEKQLPLFLVMEVNHHMFRLCDDAIEARHYLHKSIEAFQQLLKECIEEDDRVVVEGERSGLNLSLMLCDACVKEHLAEEEGYRSD